MKVGRNWPCPCGSGKKYKRCCIDNNETHGKEQVIKILSEKKDILPENREFHITKQEECRSTYTTNSFV